MKKISIVIAVVALLVPVFFVFQSFFRAGHLAFGDAPFFYSQGLLELLSEPLAWTNRGINFGGINLLVWISPLTIIYGAIGGLLKLGNDLAVRLVFYFPAVLLSMIGPYLLTRYLGKSKTIQFFTSLIYTLNTYFILVVDGGQVGVALAYGLFPFVVLTCKKLLDKPGLNSALIGVITIFTCSVADPRVAVIAVLAITVWQTMEIVLTGKFKKFLNFSYLLAVLTEWVALCMYWAFPLIKNQTLSKAFDVVNSPAFKLIDALVLFSPHWPENIYGRVGLPPIYFLLVPIIIFTSIIVSLLRKNERLVDILPFFISMIFFCFLTTASSVFTKIPFGFAFRDTTKFMIPVVLFAGILIGSSVEKINKKVFTIFVYLYLLILVWPAIFGKMNFVLSNRSSNNDFEKIEEELSADSSFYRTVWVPEHPALAHDVRNNPALDGQGLVNSFPFAIRNGGEDPYNFLTDSSFVEWFKALGIKYFILSDDQRMLTRSTEDLNNWKKILTLSQDNKGLIKQNWGTSVPVYKIEGSRPKFYSVAKVYGVVGKPVDNPNIITLNFEDGIFDPNTLKEIDPKSFSVIYNGGNIEDLQMSFLQKYLQKPSQGTVRQWAVYSHDSYLKYKYEILIRGVKFQDFDYSSGIAFSTKPGEKMEFNFKVDNPGEYVFAERSMDPSKKQDGLKWKFENLKLEKGIYKKEVINKSELSILNVVALVPKSEFDAAKTMASNITKVYGVTNLSQLKTSKLDYKEVQIEDSSTLKYKFSNSGENAWIIFSENYSPLWETHIGELRFNSYPAYSMINAFYVDPKWSSVEIDFKGQENVRWGMYISAISAITIGLIYLILKEKYGKKN